MMQNAPSGHAMQPSALSSAVALLYEPSGHGVPILTPCSQKEPGGHVRGLTTPAGQKILTASGARDGRSVVAGSWRYSVALAWVR